LPAGAWTRPFADEIRADPRFSGDLRTSAMIVVGEVDLDRQAKRERGNSQP
jgi:hypothetical protein